MKLLSEYLSKDEQKSAKVYYESAELYTVVIKDAYGTTYRTTFLNMKDAEDYAEGYTNE